jgi:hypothetical protein
MENKGEIIMYQAPDGQTAIEVKLENETVWLTQAQMIELFGRDQSVISRHIKHIFKEKELDEKSNMHFLHIANSDKPVTAYSLDVITSVGYRVKSPRGTQFRIWANKILKDYLIKGYTLNEKRLQEQSRQLEELKQTVKLLGNVVTSKELSSDEATGLLKVVTDYPMRWMSLINTIIRCWKFMIRPPKNYFRLLIKMPCGPSKACGISLVEAHFSVTKKMNRFKVRLQPFTKLSAGNMYIRVWKKKRLISFTLL